MYKGNNIIGFHRVGAPPPTTTTTTTTTAGPTTTTTTTTLPPMANTEIYFGSLVGEEATMGVNNDSGQTFSVTFYYDLDAACDNIWSQGQDPISSTSELLISTNGGGTWTSIDSVTASVSGGNYPNDQSDSQVKTGVTTITGITDITQVIVTGSYECAYTQDSKTGSIYVVISGVTVDFGTAVIICPNVLYVGCLLTPQLSCTMPTGTTTTTTTTTAGPTTTTTTTAGPTTTTTTIAPLNEWFLPSLQELLWMNSNLYTYLGNFIAPPNTWRYWSSSENNASTAWSLYSYSPSYAATAKNAGSIYHVVATRIFYSATLYNNGDVGPKGGRIFFPNYTNIRQPGTGSTYLYYECQKLADQTIGYTWSNVTGTLVGGTSVAGGTGKANTLLIISQPGHTTSAAKLCYDYNP